MPPAGAPRPDGSASNALAAYLETAIDRDALAAPHPGKLSLVPSPEPNGVPERDSRSAGHRRAAERDRLPAACCRRTTRRAASTTSPICCSCRRRSWERYLGAAEKISPAAVGDTNAPVMVNRYRLHPEQWQGARVDELPWGTRGGLAVKSDFPVDGDYLIRVELAAPADEPHQLEITWTANACRWRRSATRLAGVAGAAATRRRREDGGAQRRSTRRSSSAWRSKRVRGSSASRSWSATKSATSQRFAPHA